MTVLGALVAGAALVTSSVAPAAAAEGPPPGYTLWWKVDLKTYVKKMNKTMTFPQGDYYGNTNADLSGSVGVLKIPSGTSYLEMGS